MTMYYSTLMFGCGFDLIIGLIVFATALRVVQQWALSI